MAGPIRIAILANASNAVRGLNDTASAAEGMGSRLGKAGRVAGAALAGIGVAAGVGAAAVVAESVKSASAAQQSLGATETVYGKYAATVIKRSQEAATAIGLSANEYRELANVTGASLAATGLPMKRVTQLTGDLNTKAADLAATFGGTTSEAVQAVSSLLRGEADPIERYGVSIKQSDVTARLAAQGLDKLTGSAKKQAEQTARIDLLMQQTTKSTGAFKRESGTLANQQQVLGAQFENIKAKVGTALLPVLTRLLTIVNENMIPAFGAVASAVGPVIAKVQSFFSGVGNGNGILTTITTGLTVVGNYIATTFGPILGQVVGIVQTRVLPILSSFGQFIVGTLVPAVLVIYSNIASKLKPIFDQLAETFQTKVLPTLSKLLGKFQEAQPTIQKIIVVVAKVIGKVLEFAAAILGKVLPPVIRFAGFLLSTLAPAVASAVVVLIKIIGKVIDFGAAVIKGAQKVGEFASRVASKIGDVVGFFVALPGRIKGAIGDAGSMLLGIGGQIIDGLKAGIDAAAGKVLEAVQGVVNRIPAKIRQLMGIASPSKVTTKLGLFISAGLAAGITQGASGVEDALSAVLDRVDKTFENRLEATKKTIEKTFKGKKGKGADKAEKAALNAAEKASTANAKALKKALSGQFAALRLVGNAQDAVNEKLSQAREAYASLTSQAEQYAATVRDGVVGSASITSFGEGTGFGSIDQLLSQLEAKVAVGETYTSVIAQLTRAGLNQTNLQQLIDAGVEGGLGTAQAILNGGPAAIARINQLTARLTTAGSTLGATVAGSLYGAGLQAAAGLASGLESQAAGLAAQALAIGQNIANALAAGLANSPAPARAGAKAADKTTKGAKRKFEICSPSRVFRRIGALTAKGLAIGLSDVDVQAAGARMAGTLERGFGAPALAAYSAANGVSGTQTVEVTVNVPATANPAEVGREISKALDAYARVGGRSAA